MKVKFIPLDYDYIDIDGKAVARIFGRTSEGKRCCILDSCEAFFWVIPKQDLSEKQIEKLAERIKGVKTESADRNVFIERIELCRKNFLGNAVNALKVVVSNPKDMHVVADIVKEFDGVELKREIDIPYITRYIIEKNVLPLKWHSVEGGLLNNSTELNGIDASLDVDIVVKAERISPADDSEFLPKVMAFDIEADELEIGKGNILMISLVCGNFKRVLTWKKFHGEGYVEFCKDEAEMIEKFCCYVKDEKPDILAGYFSDGFDLPYLRARAEKNNIKLELGLDSSQPSFARGRIPSAKIVGIVHVDLFRFIETAYSQYLQSETLSLDEVASELLGERKHEFKNRSHSKESIKDHEWKDYFAYNLQDSLLTEKLFHKLWPDLLEFTRVMQEPLFNVSRDTFSQHVENYIIHNLAKYNEIAEKRPLHDEIIERRQREKYEGAFVLQPQPALYENLAVFDFTSYWPSIIVTYNLSLSTILEKKEKDALEADIGNKKVYFTKKPGFFPLMLAEIIEKRKKYKQEYKKDENPITKARSNAYKVLANASYGYQGFFGARYYCPEASAATTAISREFIKKTIEETNNNGYKVIYADTDGFAFLLQEKSKKETLAFLEKLNSELPGIMELELEDFYKRGIFVTKRTGEFGAKKKYALLNEKDQLKVRGFETVRRDWCSLAREVQNNVLEKILKEGNADSSLSYVKDIIDSIKKREVERERLIIRTQLKKPIEEYLSEGPHVAIAKKMIAKGMPVDVGMLIEFYIAEGRGKKELIRERAKLPDEEGSYDIDYYIEHQIIPAVENILAVFGITKEDLTEKRQRKLHEF